MDEMVKLSLLEDDMGVYVESQMESTKKLLELTSKFSNIIEYKVNMQEINSISVYQQQTIRKITLNATCK